MCRSLNIDKSELLLADLDVKVTEKNKYEHVCKGEVSAWCGVWELVCEGEGEEGGGANGGKQRRIKVWCAGGKGPDNKDGNTLASAHARANAPPLLARATARAPAIPRALS